MTLAQLASRISAIINFGVGRWRGCVHKGDGFYRGVINKLQARSQRRPANFRELDVSLSAMTDESIWRGIKRQCVQASSTR